MPRAGETRRLMKDGLDTRAAARLADALATSWSGFDRKGFLKAAGAGLTDLDLKDRVRHIIAVMNDYLPENYPQALRIVVRAGEKFPPGPAGDALGGFAAWPLIDWVGERGLDHCDESLKALRRLTPLFSAEFAIRPFLISETGPTLRHLHRWLDDPDEHVRRLISEGTRPRLPWGQRLPMFVRDPAPVIELLDRLKDDPADYVRRSVANNLNDIAKDHPAQVVKVCRAWKKGAPDARKWVIRHGLRTLVKQGDSGALKVLGYTTDPRVEAGLRLSAGKVKIGGVLDIEVRLTSRGRRSQKLVVDYAVHHVRRDGKTSRKVFKLRTLALDAGASVRLVKRHSFAPLSVRRYFPGRHTVELLVGGQSLARRSFTMTE